ncbi:MAG: sugar transferase [Gemmataceae bacterium]|nr:sugar transferase [Gemmataceae bacterium]MCS7270208.1 sugar transferase [Gemmataceae bacterium]MDW8243630.1 sugar transferase [Thermogemmata sp.]
MPPTLIPVSSKWSSRPTTRTTAHPPVRGRTAYVPVVVSPPTLAERLRDLGEALVAAGMLVVSAPLLALCCLIVRLTSPGPALYRQSRVGRGGRVFTLYKIRTMYHNCELYTGPRWCQPGDPRITPVGRVLRKLHLDELPQLWNVIRGDMRLIGPRPERPEIVARLRERIVGYDRRHVVKPGITGFAQIHLPPDSCLRSVKNKLAYDLFYIRRRHWRFDLYILAATLLKLFGLRFLYHRPPRYPTG